MCRLPPKREDFFALLKWRFNKCLEPTFTCSQDAIEAHSVQRKGALSLIAVDGHVYQLQGRITGDELGASLKKVGLRRASTFSGFCNAHDTDIFRPIDTKPLSAGDPEQLFLLAYRSVTKELHALMQAAMQMQQANELLVTTGRASSDVPNPAGWEAIEKFNLSWIVWKYRYEHYDQNMSAGRYRNVAHSWFVITHQEPVVAASTFFFVDQKRYGQPFAAVCTNVVPLSDQQTMVVFSYDKSHSSKARKYIAPIMMSKGEDQRYELSLLLLNKAENFHISQSHRILVNREETGHRTGFYFFHPFQCS